MLNILIAGDIYPINKDLDPFVTGDRQRILNDFKSVFSVSDFRILNMECCIYEDYKSKSGSQHPVPAKILNGVKAIGTDLICMANNHVADYGVKGLEFSVKKMEEYGLAYTGVNDQNEPLDH